MSEIIKELKDNTKKFKKDLIENSKDVRNIATEINNEAKELADSRYELEVEWHKIVENAAKVGIEEFLKKYEEHNFKGTLDQIQRNKELISNEISKVKSFRENFESELYTANEKFNSKQNFIKTLRDGFLKTFTDKVDNINEDKEKIMEILKMSEYKKKETDVNIDDFTGKISDFELGLRSLNIEVERYKIYNKDQGLNTLKIVVNKGNNFKEVSEYFNKLKQQQDSLIDYLKIFKNLPVKSGGEIALDVVDSSLEIFSDLFDMEMIKNIFDGKVYAEGIKSLLSLYVRHNKIKSKGVNEKPFEFINELHSLIKAIKDILPKVMESIDFSNELFQSFVNQVNIIYEQTKPNTPDINLSDKELEIYEEIFKSLVSSIHEKMYILALRTSSKIFFPTIAISLKISALMYVHVSQCVTNNHITPILKSSQEVTYSLDNLKQQIKNITEEQNRIKSSIETIESYADLPNLKKYIEEIEESNNIIYREISNITESDNRIDKIVILRFILARIHEMRELTEKRKIFLQDIINKCKKLKTNLESARIAADNLDNSILDNESWRNTEHNVHKIRNGSNELVDYFERIIDYTKRMEYVIENFLSKNMASEIKNIEHFYVQDTTKSIKYTFNLENTSFHDYSFFITYRVREECNEEDKFHVKELYDLVRVSNSSLVISFHIDALLDVYDDGKNEIDLLNAYIESFKETFSEKCRILHQKRKNIYVTP